MPLPRRTCTTATVARTVISARNVRRSRRTESCVACSTASPACGRGTRSAKWKAADAPGSLRSVLRGASRSSARCTRSPAWCRCAWRFALVHSAFERPDFFRYLMSSAPVVWGLGDGVLVYSTFNRIEPGQVDAKICALLCSEEAQVVPERLA